jgi:hypothetical protein
MADCKGVNKGDKKVNKQYAFVSHDAVSALLHPLMVLHGIVVVPRVVSSDQDGNRTTANMELDFVNVDQPDDRFTVSCFGYGIDSQDKGPGKAVSYATKMAMLKTFMLETGEDVERDNIDHTPPYTAEQFEQFHAYLDAGEVVLFHALRLELPPETWTALFGSFAKGEITRGKSRARTLEAEGWSRVSEYVTHIRTAIEADDQPGLLEVIAEVGELGHSVWGELNEFEKAKIKTVKEAA